MHQFSRFFPSSKDIQGERVCFPLVITLASRPPRLQPCAVAHSLRGLVCLFREFPLRLSSCWLFGSPRGGFWWWTGHWAFEETLKLDDFSIQGVRFLNGAPLDSCYAHGYTSLNRSSGLTPPPPPPPPPPHLLLPYPPWHLSPHPDNAAQSQ